MWLAADRPLQVLQLHRAFVHPTNGHAAAEKRAHQTRRAQKTPTSLEKNKEATKRATRDRSAVCA